MQLADNTMDLDLKKFGKCLKDISTLKRDTFSTLLAGLLLLMYMLARLCTI